MSKHSPGPWYWNVNAADYLELRTADEGNQGNPIIGQWGEWPPLSKPDADLIAAAPEMLELLRRFLSRMEPNVGDDLQLAAAALIARIDG